MSKTLCKEYIASILPKRTNNGNKGTFGSLISVCGSEYMTGAAYFAAMAALRSGVGLLTVAAPRSALKILQCKLNEPIFAPLSEKDGKLSIEAASEIEILSKNKTALVIGCGLGVNDEVQSVVKRVIENTDIPKIIDADALNLLSKENEPFKNCKNAVITPHPLEFSRLLKISVSDIEKNREAAASEYSRKNGVITVLKGAYTVIAAPDGKTVTAPFATSALSKGGSGDVLAGLIAGFAAQKVDLLEAAELGVYLHGLTAERASERIPQRCFLPSDILAELAGTVKYLEERE
ncbi:MAG: NAD(P)H-hydrate dehydratase [Clostridia bacterium]|nr:NAD(P)H-hydrate dehydratase [Clostridia bacterium]